MTSRIRPYQPTDYDAIKALYLQSDLYGGQFDEARDSAQKLAQVTHRDPQSILVCEVDRQIQGTISLIENGRVAWLFRFAVKKDAHEAAATEALHNAACNILRQRGHTEVLVYTPLDNKPLDQRYLNLGMTKGSPYTCFWQNLQK